MAAQRVEKSVFSAEYRHFLRLLKKARLDVGLTQTDAARRLKRPQSFVSKCESGERRVDVTELVKFCQIYGVSVVDFVRELVKSRKS